jgi:hypothetical protein
MKEELSHKQTSLHLAGFVIKSGTSERRLFLRINIKN